MNKFCGEELLALGTALAINIGKSLTEDEMSLLGALFTVIGDQLSLLSIKSPNYQNDNLPIKS